MIVAWLALAMAVAAMAVATLALLWSVRPPTKRTDSKHRLETELIDRAAIDAEIAKQQRARAQEAHEQPRLSMIHDTVSRLLHD